MNNDLKCFSSFELIASNGEILVQHLKTQVQKLTVNETPDLFVINCFKNPNLFNMN